MIPTYFLFQLAEYEGIKIEWFDLRQVDGIYISTPAMDAPVIVLSSDLQNQELKQRCVFSHELGHHFETAGHHMVATSRVNSIYRTKNELLATKWAVDLLVPTDVFLDCIHKGMTGYELCDYFLVVPDFIKTKSEMIKSDESLTDKLSELSTSYDVVF